MKEYHDKIRERAKQVYANHVLRTRGEDRWLLQRQREDGTFTSEFCTEIVALYNSSLYVGGDVDVVVFSYGPKDVQGRLRWLANSHGDYLTQKAAIGMGGRELVSEYDSDIAREELQEILEGESWSAEERAQIRDCIEGVEDHYYVLQNMPSEAWEYLGALGMVTQQKVFYAQAALARLCELLDAEEKT